MSNQAGKTDMRGKEITVLSPEGRENFDRIFSKRGSARALSPEKVEEEKKEVFKKKTHSKDKKSTSPFTANKKKK